MLPSGLFYFSKLEVRKLKIRKVDDKPMVIHTKEKIPFMCIQKKLRQEVV